MDYRIVLSAVGLAGAIATCALVSLAGESREPPIKPGSPIPASYQGMPVQRDTSPTHPEIERTQSGACPLGGTELVARSDKPAAPARAAQPVKTDPSVANVMFGQRLFLANCAMCHGSDARSGCMMAPSLVGVTERMSDEEIVSHARGLAQRMCCARHLARLSDSEFKDIVSYLHTLSLQSEEVGHRATVSRGGCCGG